MSQESSRLFQWAKTRLSVVLGLLMLTFGFLKFVSPTIDGWFHVQIQQSHLPHSAILMGKIAEIVTGTLFLLPRLRPWRGTWESPHFVDRLLKPFPGDACGDLCLSSARSSVRRQLPLGIKPPFIPLFVVGLDMMVAVSAWKDTQELHLESAPDSVVTSNSLYP